MPGLRELKKARTRRALSEVATELFAQRGFDATTVEAICQRAEVAVSTFYVYFESKEAAAFADEDVRAEVIERALAAVAEPLHVSLRAASQAVVALDLERGERVAARLRLIAGEPKLTAYAAQLQARYIDRLTAVLAARMGVELNADPRPRLIISATFAALNAAWATWATEPSHDLRALVDQAHDTLDAGFRRSLSD